MNKPCKLSVQGPSPWNIRKWGYDQASALSSCLVFPLLAFREPHIPLSLDSAQVEALGHCNCACGGLGLSDFLPNVLVNLYCIISDWCMFHPTVSQVVKYMKSCISDL